jgi:hypothetical protein
MSMSNEKYLEEMFHIAYQCGVLTEFHAKIGEIQSKNRTPYVTAVPIVFQEFKNNGLIEED